jgi:hypothetical protein
MHDQAGLLPEWAVAELRRPVMTSEALRERVMTSVRETCPPYVATRARVASGERAGRGPAVVGLSAAPSQARRNRGFRGMGATLALAASIVGMVATSTLVRSRDEPVAPVAGTSAGRMIVLGDTVDSALHDTLRLVRFVFHAPTAARVALAGDFNDWSSTATPLSDSASSGVWSVIVALEQGDRRYAFVVDDTQWVGTAANDHRASGAARFRVAPVGGDST